MPNTKNQEITRRLKQTAYNLAALAEAFAKDGYDDEFVCTVELLDAVIRMRDRFWIRNPDTFTLYHKL